MNRSVSKRQSPVSTGLLFVGAIAIVIGILAGLPILTDGAGSRHEETYPLLSLALGALGSAVLLVGLIAKGVALGIAESRER